MNDIDLLHKDLPQLIVALDSLYDSANYIHINDVKENTIYYCPCCKRVIKPRAYKNDREYQYQAHFYHENGGCNEETYVHYICKTWLFEKGCKFKIGKNIYEVEKIYTEKTYHTEFGDYRPDITVLTTSGDTFYFEIKNTNRKDENYIPKWDELGHDVVEVDVRYFINQKVIDDVPEFKIIYSNGECFIKSYTKNDYDEIIAKRKLEWKRQDKLNYKMMWEKLDWFWIKLQNFKLNSTCIQEVLNSFLLLNNEDKEICFEIIKKMSCIKEYNKDFRNLINESLKTEFTQFNIQNIVNKNVIIKDVIFYDREKFYINCFYKSNISKVDISVGYWSREWIFRRSKIIKLIDEINTNATSIKIDEEKCLMFYKNINIVLSRIRKLFHNSIWEININRRSPKRYTESRVISVQIKNKYNYNHIDLFCIDHDDFNDVTVDEIYKYVIDKLTNSMNKIFNYVDKYDGINSEYRHMFVKKLKEEV